MAGLGQGDAILRLFLGRSELEDVEFVATYRGKPIETGKKSVTVSLRFRDEDGTLRHETVDGFESKIVESLSKKVGAELRTV